jgi:hypothetical protein
VVVGGGGGGGGGDDDDDDDDEEEEENEEDEKEQENEEDKEEQEREQEQEGPLDLRNFCFVGKSVIVTVREISVGNCDKNARYVAGTLMRDSCNVASSK